MHSYVIAAGFASTLITTWHVPFPFESRSEGMWQAIMACAIKIDSTSTNLILKLLSFIDPYATE